MQVSSDACSNGDQSTKRKRDDSSGDDLNGTSTDEPERKRAKTGQWTSVAPDSTPAVSGETAKRGEARVDEHALVQITDEARLRQLAQRLAELCETPQGKDATLACFIP